MIDMTSGEPRNTYSNQTYRSNVSSANKSSKKLNRQALARSVTVEAFHSYIRISHRVPV